MTQKTIAVQLGIGAQKVSLLYRGAMAKLAASHDVHELGKVLGFDTGMQHGCRYREGRVVCAWIWGHMFAWACAALGATDVQLRYEQVKQRGPKLYLLLVVSEFTNKFSFRGLQIQPSDQHTKISSNANGLQGPLHSLLQGLISAPVDRS